MGLINFILEKNKVAIEDFRSEMQIEHEFGPKNERCDFVINQMVNISCLVISRIKKAVIMKYEIA